MASLDPCLSACPKINSKWIKDLNMRPETLKITPGSSRKYTGSDWYRERLPKQNSKGSALRETMNKWDCIKLRSFCIAKETVTRLQRQPTEWEKIFASYLSGKGLISRIYRELKILNTQRINTHMN
jgi:hypothetical protein